MRELVIGNPARLSTDVGPVIDEPARRNVLAHIEHLRQIGKVVFQPDLPPECDDGCFVPPTLIEIDTLSDLDHEVFGPVVHVLRFQSDGLAALIEAINATGYGLTLGLHSRIDETARLVAASARVGNIYVNRNMIGAVVGVQPFGGEGLSGTGPKAGGPLYLHRLAGSSNVIPAELGCRSDASPLAGGAPFPQLTLWASSCGRRDLFRHCADYADLTPLLSRIDLPGPTGERNTLIFAPSGRMLCLAADEESLLGQLAAVFATGNVAATLDDAIGRSVRAMLPRPLSRHVELQATIEPRGLAGVLYAGDALGAENVRKNLAAAPGALIPVFEAAPETGLYPLYRMMVERVICVNTTASGGNAALMTLGA